MTLPISPNPISMSQINVELGFTANATISLNDTAVRTLSNRKTNNSTNSMDLFRGLTDQIPISFLAIAGGGGGGINWGGGGGAGGLGIESAILHKNRIYTVTVGAGGASNASGNNSAISTVWNSIAGGRGGSNLNYSQSTPGDAGGSGGGGGGSPSGTASAGGAGTAGQGYDGGDGYIRGVFAPCGGGGGAGGVGENAGSNSGAGGPGFNTSISGVSTTYGGGGGGGGGAGGNLSCYRGAGGSGGGGAGGYGAGAVGVNGTANTGAGGGGGGDVAGEGGSGGSGVVILVIPTAQLGTYTGATATISGTSTVLTFASSGSYTA